MLDQPSLLLDIGNTSIKYAWYSFPNDIADLQVLRTTIDSIEELLEQASDCWLCCVVSDDTTGVIKGLCDKVNIECHQSTTHSMQYDVKNAYATPKNMGVDRWMAIIASSYLCDKGQQSNFLVIDAGTAITCDFVVANNHVGGWIAPGLAMARSAVVSNTQRVFDDQHTLHNLDVGTDTPECVSQGALAQLSGMLIQACNVMQSRCNKFDLFISGGDAPLLINVFTQLQNISLRPSINYLENLVLIGLARTAHDKMAKNA